jgi:uncharacterized protein (TIGR02598 family)
MQIFNHRAVPGTGAGEQAQPALSRQSVADGRAYGCQPCPVQVPACLNSVRCGAAPAFTLVEVLVAVAVLGVVMLALLAAFRQSFGLVDDLRENLRATQILQEKMEMIRLYNWDQITNSGYIPAGFTEAFDPTAGTNTDGVNYTGTVIVTNAPLAESYAADLRLVMVNLNWTSDDGVAHVRDMTTLVSRYGLQNYIY